MTTDEPYTNYEGYEAEVEELEAIKKVSAPLTQNISGMERVMNIPHTELPDSADIKKLAQAATPAAIATLVEVLHNPRSSTTVRVNAATALLDRAHGKPHQSSTVQGGLTFNVVSTLGSLPYGTVIEDTGQNEQTNKVDL